LASGHSNAFGRDQPVDQLTRWRMWRIAEKGENIGEINFGLW
jgi:hypothetical protein